MKRTNSTLLAIVPLLVSGLTFSDVPNTFVSGSPALASEVNENFSDLDTRLTSLEATMATSVSIDCSNDTSALVTAIEAGKRIIDVTGGSCLVPEAVYKADLTITGQNGAILDTLANGSMRMDIRRLSAVNLKNLTVTGGLAAFDGSNLALENVTLQCGTIEYCLTVKSSTLMADGGVVIDTTGHAATFIDGAHGTFVGANSLKSTTANTLEIGRNSSAMFSFEAGVGSLVEGGADFHSIWVYGSSHLQMNGSHTVRGNLEFWGSSGGLGYTIYEPNVSGSKTLKADYGSSVEFWDVDFSNTQLWSATNSSVRLAGMSAYDLTSSQFWVPNGHLVVSGGWLGTPDFIFFQGAVGSFFSDGPNTISANFSSRRGSYVEFQNDFTFENHTFSCADVSDIIYDSVNLCP